MKRFVQFRTLVLCGAFAALIILCLGLSASAAATWTAVRSKNFLLIGDANEKDIRAVAIGLEQFRFAIRQIYPGLKLPDAVGTRVMVFRDAASYHDFKPKRTDGTLDDTVAGFFVPGDDVNYITLSAGDRSDPLATAAHEYFHAVLDANYRHREIPPWLNEGLAEYFQTMHIAADKSVTFGTPRTDSFNLLRRTAAIPLKNLIETDGEQLSSMADQPRSLFYAEAAALVHYLMQASAGTPDAKLGKFLSLLNDKESGEKVFQRIFQKGYADTETALRAYLEQKGPPSAAVTVRLDSLPENSTSSAPIHDAEAFAYLGDLLGHLDETAEAEVMLRKALVLDQKATVANSSLGMLLLRQDKFTEAKKFLANAAAADNANFLTQFNYAFVLSREGVDAHGYISELSPETEELMRAALQKAMALNPDFAESYRLLAFVDYVNGGDLDEAVSLLKKGLTLQPGDEDFETLLAQVLLRQEKYPEAKEIASRIRKTATDARLLSDADEVLRTVDEYYAVKPKTYEADTGSAISPMPRLLFIKRSSISDADIARFDEDRQINNLNRVLEHPKPGEKQIVGHLERVSCTDGGISYSVGTADGRVYLTSADFGDLRLAVLTEGQNSYRIDCGVNFGKQLTVLTYRPTAGAKTRSLGQLSGITFVPDYFRLKTPEELAKARLVVVEDDTLRGSHRREKQP